MGIAIGIANPDFDPADTAVEDSHRDIHIRTAMRIANPTFDPAHTAMQIITSG